jgi:hypothetical protein
MIVATKPTTLSIQTIVRQPFFIILWCLFNVVALNMLLRLWDFGDSNCTFPLLNDDITFDISVSDHKNHHQHITNRRLSDPVSVITLSYDPHVNGGKENELKRKRNLAESVMLHNCMLIQQYNNISRNDASMGVSSPAFNYLVYTDNLSLEVCQHCECQEFKRYNCPCAVKDCKGDRNVCEKNHLFSDLLVQKGEFIYVDFDMAMLYPTVLEELKVRSQTTDFLATRAHASFRKSPGYRSDFNSGLVYIRKVPEVDPMLLRQYMYANFTNGRLDQAVLSDFVHHHYKRWDELSIKWHCRLINIQSNLSGRKNTDIYPDMDIHDCQTIHPPTDEILAELNYTLLAP